MKKKRLTSYQSFHGYARQNNLSILEAHLREASPHGKHRNSSEHWTTQEPVLQGLLRKFFSKPRRIY